MRARDRPPIQRRGYPRRAASIAATSIFLIVIMAENARLASPPPAASASAILVAVTGYGREEDRKASLDAGFDDHWVKPIDLGALSNVASPSAPVA